MTHYVPIVLQGISWSGQHGHPLLLLRALESDVSFAVVADVDEARALASCSCTRERTRRRLAVLIVELLRTLGATLLEIVLHLDEHGTLRATLHIGSHHEVHTFEVAGSDALLLAAETGIVPVTAASDLLAIDRGGHEPSQASDELPPLPPDVRALLAELERFGWADDHREPSS